MRLIDLDKVRIEIAVPRGRKFVQEVIDKLNDKLDKLPTVDAVPVVRCKDCIYYHPFAEIKGKGECHIVEDAECLTWYEDCDYCSYGERRDEDETH